MKSSIDKSLRGVSRIFCKGGGGKREEEGGGERELFPMLVFGGITDLFIMANHQYFLT